MKVPNHMLETFMSSRDMAATASDREVMDMAMELLLSRRLIAAIRGAVEEFATDGLSTDGEKMMARLVLDTLNEKTGLPH